jgi:integrase
MKPVQLPSGAWRLKVYIGKNAEGKNQYVSVTRNDKNECLMEAANLARHHKEIERDSSTMTLEEAIEKYISIKSNVLSPSTIRCYTNIKKNHLQPEMQLQLRKITDDVAQAAINRESKTKSPKTVQNVYLLLSAVMKRYAKRSLDVTLPQKEIKEPNMLNETQMKTLVKAVENTEMEVPVLLALFLGLRRSEILALTHDDYNPESKTISITKALVPDKNHQMVLKPPKSTSSTRTLPVPEYLSKRLEDKIKKDIPFCTVCPSKICKKLHDICEKCGLPYIRFHDLRHHNSSVMLALGVADK